MGGLESDKTTVCARKGDHFGLTFDGLGTGNMGEPTRSSQPFQFSCPQSGQALRAPRLLRKSKKRFARFTLTSPAVSSAITPFAAADS
jgi:hypothetical protein